MGLEFLFILAALIPGIIGGYIGWICGGDAHTWRYTWRDVLGFFLMAALVVVCLTVYLLFGTRITG